MPKTYVETSSVLIEGIDEMIREGFYHDRTEAVNDALRILLKQYKLSKLHAKDTRSNTPETGGKEIPGGRSALDAEESGSDGRR